MKILFHLWSPAAGKLCCLVPVCAACQGASAAPENILGHFSEEASPYPLLRGLFSNIQAAHCNSEGCAIIMCLNFCATCFLVILPRWCWMNIASSIVFACTSQNQYGKMSAAFCGTSVLLANSDAVGVLSQLNSTDSGGTGRWGKKSFVFLNNVLLPSFFALPHRSNQA